MPHRVFGAHSRRTVFGSTFVVVCILAGVGIGGIMAPPPNAAYVPASVTVTRLQLDLDSRTATALREHSCTEPASWHALHPDRFPRTMLVKPARTFELRVIPATFTPPAGSWVLGFCDR